MAKKDRKKDHSCISWQEFYFHFFITFCIKLKFFSLQHTLSCDVKEVKRVGQKTLWHHNILQAYKVQKVEKRVALHLTAVCYNNGDGQKKAHTKEPHRPQQPSQSNPIHWRTGHRIIRGSSSSPATSLTRRCQILNPQLCQSSLLSFSVWTRQSSEVKSRHGWIFQGLKYLVVALRFFFCFCFFFFSFFR